MSHVAVLPPENETAVCPTFRAHSTGDLLNEAVEMENPSKIDELRAAYQKYSTSLIEEPNVSWRDTGEPTAAGIAEAQRQKAEVKVKWTNPDGTMKKGYHCAPNGKPSRLTEEQWLAVRTPNFKRWFGDWESLAEAYPENEIFDIDEAYKFARKNLQGGSFTSKDGYGATLGREGIDKMNSGLARGKTANNRLHALAFANIGKLFGNSELLETEPPRDGNTNIKRYLKFYAPLYMDGLYAVKITVKELSGNNGNRLYSIEGLDITKESEYRGQSRGSKENSIPADYSDSVNNFVKKLREVKGNVSKVVDENGEPLVVYHGTDWKPLAEKAGEAVFKSSLIKNSSEGFGFYFTKDKTLASGFGEPVACFLNLRNPKYAYDRLSLISTEELEDGDVDVENFDAENAARIRNALGEWKNAMEAKGWDFYNEIDPYLLDGLPKETNTIESILDYVLSADSFLKAEDYNAEDFYNDAREAAADVFGIDGYISENYGNDSGVYVALKPNQIKSATDNVGTFSDNPDIRWSIREDSDAEKIDRKHRELYERYKSGEVSADDLQREIDDFMNDFHSERTPERKIIERATPKERIYDIDEAVDFVRKNLLNKPIHSYVEQEGKIVSATISRNCLDKINSGNSRGKTNNNRLYALAVANIDRLFTLSRRLESEPPKNGSPELKAVHRHYAPLLMDGKIYAVKLTVKEFDEKTGNRIYSIEGIDVNGESDLSGLSKKEENPNSSAAIQRSDSVKEFIDEIRNVNKKFHDLARGKISEKAYEEAAKLVADYAESKGYDVKVYHGTGADGFNVAKADASEAKNGEGAQAHGMGLYMAKNKATAEAYQKNAPKQDFRTIGGRTLKELGITRENFDGYPVEGLVRTLNSLGIDDAKRIVNERIKKQEERLKSSENALAKTENDFGKKLAQEEIDNAKQQIANDKKALSAIDKLLSILEENGLSISDYEYRISDGKLFEWFTNLKPERLLYENRLAIEEGRTSFDVDFFQYAVRENLDFWDAVREKIEENNKGKSEAEIDNICNETEEDFNYEVGDTSSLLDWLGKIGFSEAEKSKLLLKCGFQGIAYDGRQDGKCYVSFEGGAAVKLQDPFTFDDNGQLIPLSKRFDSGNPDMRWKDDTDISDIFAKVEKIIDSVSDKKNQHIEVLRKVSDEEADFLLKKTGLNLKGYSHSIDNYSILHILKKHGSKKELQRGQIPVTIEDIRKFPTIVSDYDDVEYVGKSNIGRDTIRFEKSIGGNNVLVFEEMRVGKKLLALSTMYIQKRKKLTSNANASSNTSETLSTSSDFQESENAPENQEKNSRLRFLLRQERTENPVIWASIVLAREILNGRGITRAKVEKLLPTEQFDGSKQNYAVERAQRIAEKTKATQKQFSKDLDIAIRKAESNLYWQDEFVENAYRAFSKGGEEYGFAKQRLMQYLKDLRNKELNKVKGYETADFDVDLVDAILKAQEAEPERVSADESKTAGEEAEEELEESGGAFEGDEELSGKKTPLAPSKIRDVIGAIRREVVKRVRDSDGDQKTLDEKYRKTLVNVLTDAMKELVYGKEREDIGKKIEELKNVKHAVITVKDGERVGQKIDNFTLRAENIALRIFKRGVRDSKKLMTEKLDAILKRRGKKPSRMQRDDKRSMTGLVQQRIYNISRYVEMDAEALEDVRREAVEKLENIDENFVQDAEKGKIREDVEDVRAEVVNVLHDIEMFGGWDDKSRAEMAQALEFLEKTIDTETAAQKVNVMWKLLTAPKNIMTQAITKTPEFAIRNFIRYTGSNTILFGGKTIAPYLAHTAKNAVKSAWNTADMQYNLIEAVNTRLGKISRKRKALGADRTLSTEELIRADDELLAERNQLLADVDILIDRVEKGDFNARDMRDILKRIRNADREKRDSKKARVRLRELANMR